MNPESRKRIIETHTAHSTPPKKRRSAFSSFGYIFAPISSIVDMFRGNVDANNSTSKKFTVFEEDVDDEQEEVKLVKTVYKSPQATGTQELIYLNDVNNDDDETIKENKAVEEQVKEKEEENDVLEVTNEVQEEENWVPVEEKIEKVVEHQEDDDIEIISDNLKKPKSPVFRARHLQNEIIFLNEDAERTNAESDCEEIVSPEDSASRSNTPISANTSTSKTMRDYWRRNTNKSLNRKANASPFSDKTTISRNSSPLFKKYKENNTSNALKPASLEKYIQTLLKEGVLTDDPRKSKPRRPAMTSSQRANELISKSWKLIDSISKSGRTTPRTIASSSSNTSLNMSGRFLAGSRRSSIMSESSSSRITEILDKFAQVDLSSKIAEEKFKATEDNVLRLKCKDEELTEESRIRAIFRHRTREEREEEVRKRLAVKGIVLKPRKTKATELVELPEEAHLLADKVWSRGRCDIVVEEFSLKLTQNDLKTLYGLNWLNDEVINFYLNMITHRSKENASYPKTYAFSTFFYESLTKKGYAGVRRWTKKVDIFSHDVILVPIHLQLHWCMAVIDMKEKKIDYYDSLLGNNHQCLQLLKEYLSSESMDKKKQEFDLSGWSFEHRKDIPRQQNGSDCGVFSCQFGEYASRRAAIAFEQENMNYYRRRMLYEICNKKLLSSI